MGSAATSVLSPVTRELSRSVGDITGANQAAEAAQNAANAQARAARQTRSDILTQARRNRQRAGALAEATPQELAALDRAYSSADQALSREERLIAAVDPSIMEASQQALKLLRGETADVNKPLTDLRNSQRQQLVDSLRNQYGPGAESSSLGQQALRRFDMETSSMFAQNQQSALANAFGIATTDLGGRLTRGIGTVQQVGQGYSALQERRLNTELNIGAQTIGALSGTSQQLIQSAGAPYVGDALRAQSQQQLFNTGLQLGAAYFTGGASLAAGGLPAPTGLNARAASATVGGGSYNSYGNYA